MHRLFWADRMFTVYSNSNKWSLPPCCTENIQAQTHWDWDSRGENNLGGKKTKINRTLRITKQQKPKINRETENGVMPENERPRCGTGWEQIIPIQYRQSTPDKTSFTDCWGTLHQQPNDLYITAQNNHSLQLNKVKGNYSMSSHENLKMLSPKRILRIRKWTADVKWFYFKSVIDMLYIRAFLQTF